MKKILVALLALVASTGTAHADACTTALGLAFSPAQTVALCGKLGKAYSIDFAFITGKTIAIQEATAASKCMGSVTANGTTAVTVSTTCATTGSRIFLSRSSAPSGTAICWQTNIVTGVSFDVDCSGAETGTFDWFIVHEAA